MRKCVVCGREFIPLNSKNICCSEKCRHAHHNGYKRKGVSARRRYIRKPQKNLDEWLSEAQSCGMSYGKYRAAINQGKTFEELKNYYESNRIEN